LIMNREGWLEEVRRLWIGEYGNHPDAYDEDYWLLYWSEEWQVQLTPRQVIELQDFDLPW